MRSPLKCGREIFGSFTLAVRSSVGSELRVSIEGAIVEGTGPIALLIRVNALYSLSLYSSDCQISSSRPSSGVISIISASSPFKTSSFSLSVSFRRESLSVSGGVSSRVDATCPRIRVAEALCPARILFRRASLSASVDIVVSGGLQSECRRNRQDEP